MQETGLLRNALDQFYTSPEVARSCMDVLRPWVEGTRTWIEPSAGTGVFLELVPEALGYDIEPKHPRIQTANFLDVDVPEGAVVYGNPPFGRQSSTAKAFIAHSARTASIIAFVLPRSFSKPSMQKVFPPAFHLVESLELPKNSFIVNGSPYHVPCIFQVWKRKETPRDSVAETKPVGFAFVKSTEPHDMVFRRVGVNAGQCNLPGQHSPQSHYFLHFNDPRVVHRVIEQTNQHTFPSNTTGPRSLSKSETAEFLNTAIADATRRLDG